MPGTPLRQEPDPRVLAAIEDARSLADQVFMLILRFIGLDQELAMAGSKDEDEADRRRKTTGLFELSTAMDDLEQMARWLP